MTGTRKVSISRNNVNWCSENPDTLYMPNLDELLLSHEKILQDTDVRQVQYSEYQLDKITINRALSLKLLARGGVSTRELGTCLIYCGVSGVL